MFAYYIQMYLWQTHPQNLISGIAANVSRRSSWQGKAPPPWLLLMGCVIKITPAVEFQSNLNQVLQLLQMFQWNDECSFFKKNLPANPAVAVLQRESWRCFPTDLKVIRCVQHQTLLHLPHLLALQNKRSPLLHADKAARARINPIRWLLNNRVWTEHVKATCPFHILGFRTHLSLLGPSCGNHCTLKRDGISVY